MSETSQSPWAEPTEVPKTPAELLEASYPDRENPDDIDNMVDAPGERKARNERNESSAKDPYGVGKEIFIDRSADKETGAPAYVEGGWKITKSDLQKQIPGSDKYVNGVVVEKTLEDGKIATKEIPMHRVYELNPITPEAAENEPLDDVEIELADEAIESATGVKDPEEVANDLQQAREAAEKMIGETPPLTKESLQAMMSGENVEDLKIQVPRDVHLTSEAFPGYVAPVESSSEEPAPHDPIEDAKMQRITVIDPHPTDPPKRNHW